MSIGANIRRIREEKGLKQVELAKAANVSKQCISDYKKGKSVPSIDTLYLICKFLDVSADYLLGLEDQ